LANILKAIETNKYFVDTGRKGKAAFSPLVLSPDFEEVVQTCLIRQASLERKDFTDEYRRNMTAWGGL
jgi:arylamine N-acetyltransferase